MTQRPDDMLASRVRFVCGALFGLLLGLGIYCRVGLVVSDSAACAVACIAVPALAIGAASARRGDAFWDRLTETRLWRLFSGYRH